MTYETDEERVEALKKWWKENGVSVIAGAALGLGAIYGWRLWIGHQESVAAQASTAFEQLMANASARSPQPDAIGKQLQLIEDEFGSTPYPSLGALVAAKALYDAGKPDEAVAALRQAITDAPDPALARIAALRLARVQAAQGELDAAEQTVKAHDTSAAFAGEFAAVRGDIAAQRGDTEGARRAYEEAIEKGSALSQLLRLKIDNLPAAG
ncbi:tetratricopeptide repeat protein [Thiorhodococcus minor]|uniref:Ancillary SecYEG translocon subunit n=1 Tax=Thiorhodococcus minor TaxID=57489 RepID=A0A6M0JW26_9GAMM|nr:tetratricopeptide repeat protein [Thiorhodococcus minor]